MMRKLNPALTCVVVVLLSGSNLGGSSKVDLESYLDIPSSKQLSRNKFHQEIEQALARLDVSSSDGSKESILEILKDSLASQLTKPSYRHTYQDLLSLTDNDDYCSRDMVDLYYSVWAQMSPNTKNKNLNKFLQYIVEFGKVKFQICATTENANFKLRLFSSPDLDRVFKKAFDIGPNCPNSVLYAKLKDFEMDKDAFNVDRMIQEAKEFVGQNQKDKFVIFEEFMKLGCQHIGRTVPPDTKIYKIINMERRLGSQVSYDPTLLLENEFYRLCLAWGEPEVRDAIEKNVRSQFEKKRWFERVSGWWNNSDCK